MQKTHTRHAGDKWRCRVAGQYTPRLDRPTAGPRRIYAAYSVAVLDREREPPRRNALIQFAVLYLQLYALIIMWFALRRNVAAWKMRRATGSPRRDLQLENAGWRHFELNSRVYCRRHYGIIENWNRSAFSLWYKIFYILNFYLKYHFMIQNLLYSQLLFLLLTFFKYLKSERQHWVVASFLILQQKSF